MACGRAVKQKHGGVPCDCRKVKTLLGNDGVERVSGRKRGW